MFETLFTMSLIWDLMMTMLTVTWMMLIFVTGNLYIGNGDGHNMPPLSEAAKDIVQNYARVKPDDRVLVITDAESGVVAGVFAQQAKLVSRVEDDGRLVRPQVTVAYLDIFLGYGGLTSSERRFPNPLAEALKEATVSMYAGRDFSSMPDVYDGLFTAVLAAAPGSDRFLNLQGVIPSALETGLYKEQLAIHLDQ